jgi:hypothetical protein
MAVTTVVPNGTVSGASLYDIAGGSATVHAALSDASDSTYITKKSSVSGAGSIVVDFGTTTIGATSKVKRVRIRARVLTPDATGKMSIFLGSRISNENYFYGALAVRGAYVSATTFTGAWQNYAPNGGAWTQATIDGLRAKITEYNDSTSVGRFIELFIDVDIVSQPTVTISAPSGTISANAAPDVNWSMADVDGETQTYYQFKIFTAAQFGAGGFNVNTSVATYDSGEVASVDNSSVVGTLLLNGSYRAYVRAGKTTSGVPFYSDWQFSSFTMSYSAPTTPTLTAVWDENLGRSTIVVTGAVPTGFSSQYFEIERSDDSGVTYDVIRNGSPITPSGTYVATVLDYEAPRNAVGFYRSRSVGVDGSGNEFPTVYSNNVSVFATNDGSWWFKAITNPSISRGSVRVLAQLDTNIEEPNTVFRPLGENRPIVVAGLLQGEDGIYSIKTVTEDEWDDLYPIIEHQGTLLVQDPQENQKYVRVIGRTWSAESSQNGIIFRNIDLAYVEVDG